MEKQKSSFFEKVRSVSPKESYQSGMRLIGEALDHLCTSLISTPNEARGNEKNLDGGVSDENSQPEELPIARENDYKERKEIDTPVDYALDLDLISTPAVESSTPLTASSSPKHESAKIKGVALPNKIAAKKIASISRGSALSTVRSTPLTAIQRKDVGMTIRANRNNNSIASPTMTTTILNSPSYNSNSNNSSISMTTTNTTNNHMTTSASTGITSRKASSPLNRNGHTMAPKIPVVPSKISSSRLSSCNKETIFSNKTRPIEAIQGKNQSILGPPLTEARAFFERADESSPCFQSKALSREGSAVSGTLSSGTGRLQGVNACVTTIVGTNTTKQRGVNRPSFSSRARGSDSKGREKSSISSAEVSLISSQPGARKASRSNALSPQQRRLVMTKSSSDGANMDSTFSAAPCLVGELSHSLVSSLHSTSSIISGEREFHSIPDSSMKQTETEEDSPMKDFEPSNTLSIKETSTYRAELLPRKPSSLIGQAVYSLASASDTPREDSSAFSNGCHPEIQTDGIEQQEQQEQPKQREEKVEESLRRVGEDETGVRDGQEEKGKIDACTETEVIDMTNTSTTNEKDEAIAVEKDSSSNIAEKAIPIASADSKVSGGEKVSDPKGEKPFDIERLLPPVCCNLSKVLDRERADPIYEIRSTPQHMPQITVTPEVSSLLCDLTEECVLKYLEPSLAGLQRRREHLHELASHLTEAIRACGAAKGIEYGTIRYYIFGSVNMRTVLPDGDNDITIEIDGLLGGRPEYRASDVYRKPSHGAVTLPATTDSCAANKEGTLQLITDSTGKPQSVPPSAIGVAAGDLLTGVRDYLLQGEAPILVDTLVVAEVRVLKLVMKDCSYDITINQFGGINCVRFLHEMDMAIGGQHLLKRTLLLLKSWCCYEAHVLGGQGGYIGSYAATVMLISMINTVEFIEDEEKCCKESVKERSSLDQSNGSIPAEHYLPSDLRPLTLFARFLKFYSYFDFDRYCVTAFGPLKLEHITNTPYDLSKLEVPAARKTKERTVTEPDTAAATNNDIQMTASPNMLNVSDSKPSGDRKSSDRDGDPVEETDSIGLTEEGKKAIGSLVCRRKNPLLTVSGVKHLLHELNTSRELERQNRYQNQRRAQEQHTKEKLAEEIDSNSGSHEGTTLPAHSPMNRPGLTEEDSDLICPSCTTAMFPVRVMNVLDPLRWSSNMCRGICRNHLQRIKRAFREGLTMMERCSVELEAQNSLTTSKSCPSSGISTKSSEVSTTSSIIPPLNTNDNLTSPTQGILDFSEFPLPEQQAFATNGAQSHPALSEPVHGYPFKQCKLSRRESDVLRYLYGNTINKINKFSAYNDPCVTTTGGKRGNSALTNLPKCNTCTKHSLLCTPNFYRACQAQFAFESPRVLQSMIFKSPADREAYKREQRQMGPLGECFVPFVTKAHSKKGNSSSKGPNSCFSDGPNDARSRTEPHLYPAQYSNHLFHVRWGMPYQHPPNTTQFQNVNSNASNTNVSIHSETPRSVGRGNFSGQNNAPQYDNTSDRNNNNRPPITQQVKSIPNEFDWPPPNMPMNMYNYPPRHPSTPNRLNLAPMAAPHGYFLPDDMYAQQMMMYSQAHHFNTPPDSRHAYYPQREDFTKQQKIPGYDPRLQGSRNGPGGGPFGMKNGTGK